MTIAYIFMHVVKQIKQTKGMEIESGGAFYVGLGGKPL